MLHKKIKGESKFNFLGSRTKKISIQYGNQSNNVNQCPPNVGNTTGTSGITGKKTNDTNLNKIQHICMYIYSLLDRTGRVNKTSCYLEWSMDLSRCANLSNPGVNDLLIQKNKHKLNDSIKR